MGNRADACLNRTSTTNGTSYEQLSECWIEKSIADWLRFCLPLIILPISLINNLLSFTALRSRHMRGTSTAFFMLSLSVLDPLVLITKNLVYFPTFVVANAVSCKILYFLIYVLGYTNVWILVIMTGDKFFAVWFPLKVSYFCTISRARYICVILLLLTSFISMHHFWTTDSFVHPHYPGQRFCHYDLARYGSIQHLWRYVDFAIWCFLPFVLILALSVLIIYRLRQRRSCLHAPIRHLISTQREGQFFGEALSDRFRFLSGLNSTRASKGSSEKMTVRSSQNKDVIRSRHRHITLMLLSVAFVFLLLTLPNSIYFVLDLTYGFNRLPTVNDYPAWLRYRRLTILTVIMFQLSDLQHAANFFIYLLTSHKFRQSVMINCLWIVHRLSSLLSSSCQQTIDTQLYSSERLRKTQRGLSLQSSAAEMSGMTRTTRSASTAQRPSQPVYEYRLFASHPRRHNDSTKTQVTKVSL